MQIGQDPFEWLQYFVFFPEFLEVLRLFTKNGGNGFDGVAILEALGERVFGQFYARLLLVSDYKQQTGIESPKAASKSTRKRDDPDWSVMGEEMWDWKGDLVRWEEKAGG